VTDNQDNGASRPVILMPVLNDWQSFSVLVRQLDDQLTEHGYQATVVVIDDGSTDSPPQPESMAFRSIPQVVFIKLKRNLGHQRAIAIGLSYLCDQHPCPSVLVMDSDGEDAPSDVPRLFDYASRTREDCVVFAKRMQRSEPIWFRISYSVYKFLFRAMTGQRIQFGNFSIIPWDLLQRVAGVSEIWNHYSAGLMKARIPIRAIDTSRGRRIAGKPAMRLTALLTHGLSSIAVFSEVVGTRLCVAALALAVIVLLTVVVVVSVRLFTDRAIPGWATYVVGLLLLMLMQAVMFCFVFLFLVLSGRNAITFIPQKDYSWFILNVKKSRTNVWAASNT
jgi:polyisoprenyl-phosphate glycosyltransferase